ncbi:MAG TPA: magnesium/cobalt transporter CorA [Nitrospiraceae bacterium]|nr:magnesium/cobalt transporter CorA [Nitrospiraceae bacterium]
MKLVQKRSRKAGLPPGTLVHIGEKKSETVKITVFDYDDSHFQERQVAKAEDVPIAPEPCVTWVDVGGVHKIEILESFGKLFGLHSLILEDIANTDQRPKLDDYGSYGYVVLKMVYEGERRGDIMVEQVSLVYGDNFLLSFQENGGDVFQAVKDHLRSGKGRLRHAGSDYLLYALIDSIVDRYFVVLETVGERIEALQDLVVANPQPETLREIHALKRQLLFLRRSVWPLRDVINNLSRAEGRFFEGSTKVFFRDVYDHLVQIVDTVESLREMVSSMLEIYLSSVSYRLNAVMKVLTIITTIFMPLSFIASIYGMNFEHMPELKSSWGYPAVLGIMGVIGTAMLAFFKRKNWL